MKIFMTQKLPSILIQKLSHPYQMKWLWPWKKVPVGFAMAQHVPILDQYITGKRRLMVIKLCITLADILQSIITDLGKKLSLLILTPSFHIQIPMNVSTMMGIGVLVAWVAEENVIAFRTISVAGRSGLVPSGAQVF